VNRRAISTVGRISRRRTGAQHPWWAAQPVPSVEPARGSADAPAAYPPYGDYGHGRIHVEADAGRVSAAHPAHYRQRGAVLAVSLIFLLLLSIVAISLMRSGQLEVLMAGNAQSRLSAFEMAEGITEAIMVRWEEDNFESNTIVCSAGHPNTDGKCDEFNLMWDLRLNPAENHSSLLPQAKGAQVTARVRPLNDGKDICPPPEFMPGHDLDTPVLLFEVEAAFDLVQLRQGASRVHRGVALRNMIGACKPEPKSGGNLDQFAHLRY